MDVHHRHVFPILVQCYHSYFLMCSYVRWSGSVNDLINLSKLQQRKSDVEKNCKNGLNEASCGALQKVFLL